jgi:hypothetical protein
MNRPHDYRGLLVLLALCALSPSACMTMARVHPELEARRSRITRVAVLPPETKFVLVTFKGDNPRMSAEEDSAKAVLPGMIATKLREHGLVVDETGATSNSDLRFQATELQATFDQALGDLFAAAPGTKPIQTSRSLGTQAARVADPLGVDALAVVRVEGYTKSGGEIAKDYAKSVVGTVLTLGVLVPIPSPASGAAMVCGLVDGSTGDVLWTNATRAPSASLDAPGMQTLVNAVFRDFPAGRFGPEEAISIKSGAEGVTH